MTRLLVVTGTRADFGLWMPVLEAAARRSGIEARLLVTAMHLEPAFGATVDVVRRSGVPIAGEVRCTPAGDSREEMAVSLGTAVVGMAALMAAERPDWVCLLGDRGEQLAAALVALHLGFAIAHVHGGEQTLGAIDDAFRDMISRAAHLHFVANEQSAARLQAMGEEPWRIHVTGAPGLDDIRGRTDLTDRTVRSRYGLPESGDYLLLVQHPETAPGADPIGAISATLAALDDVGIPTFAISPNADAGGRAIQSALAQHRALIGHVPSLERAEYLALLEGAAALVGNSSSGIIEAPLLGVPAVNIGSRQEGRARGENVIDVPADRARIAEAIDRAIDPPFRRALSRTSSYGDGSASQRIVELLAVTHRDDRLMTKRVAS